jgi:hypothetical protein
MDPVGLVAADSDRQSIRNGQDILSSVVVRLLVQRRPCQMVALPGLVIDDRNGARRPGAEGILRGGVGYASSGQDSDILGRIVRTGYLIEMPVVCAEE